MCPQPANDYLSIDIYDHDRIGRDDPLGKVVFNVSSVESSGFVDIWLDVRDFKNINKIGRGQLHIAVTYFGEKTVKPSYSERAETTSPSYNSHCLKQAHVKQQELQLRKKEPVIFGQYPYRNSYYYSQHRKQHQPQQQMMLYKEQQILDHFHRQQQQQKVPHTRNATKTTLSNGSIAPFTNNTNFFTANANSATTFCAINTKSTTTYTINTNFTSNANSATTTYTINTNSITITKPTTTYTINTNSATNTNSTTAATSSVNCSSCSTSTRINTSGATTTTISPRYPSATTGSSMPTAIGTSTPNTYCTDYTSRELWRGNTKNISATPTNTYFICKYSTSTK